MSDPNYSEREQQPVGVDFALAGAEFGCDFTKGFTIVDGDRIPRLPGGTQFSGIENASDRGRSLFPTSIFSYFQGDSGSMR